MDDVLFLWPLFHHSIGLQTFKFESTCIPSAGQVKTENCLGQDNETGFEEV